jgi:ketosteroid isomerase-like protein
MGDTTDSVHAAVIAANHAFYEAFEAHDIDAMAAVWELSDRVVCTHPGWTTLHGWPKVGASWRAIFNGTPLQFILTNEHVVVNGDTAVVTNDENLIDPRGSGTVAALNVFARGDQGWRLIAHHGSSVMRTA